MSERDTHADERAAIEALLNRIETGEWVVTDYDPSTDPDGDTSVTATIEQDTPKYDAEIVTTDEQRERVRTLKDIINQLEQMHDEGAPVDDVVQEATEIDIEQEAARKEIEKLRTKGEVYEPKADHLRAT